jgi:hypothetical protein
MWKDCRKREKQATISRAAQLTADGTQLDDIINKKLAAALKSLHLPHSDRSSALYSEIDMNKFSSQYFLNPCDRMHTYPESVQNCSSEALSVHPIRNKTDFAFKIDSGASRHFCGIKKMFQTYRRLRPGEFFGVRVADNSIKMVKGVGTVCIRTENNQRIVLDPVYFLPNFQNLVSVSALYGSSRIRIRLEDDRAVFYEHSTGQHITDGPFINNHWLLDGTVELSRRLGQATCLAVSAPSPQIGGSTALWHARLFHIGHDRMLKTCTVGHGIMDNVSEPVGACLTCMVANAKNVPHPISKRPSALQPLERLHADLVESPIPNVSGKRYWASVTTDEFSRWTWVLFLKNKSDFKEAFLGLLLCLEGTLNRCVLALHTDRGGEVMSNDLRQFLHTRGIVTSTTSAGSPESNGIAERTQGVIKSMMRPALLASGLKPGLWSECVAAAT